MFSPDGKRVDLTGGEILRQCPVPPDAAGSAWRSTSPATEVTRPRRGLSVALVVQERIDEFLTSRQSMASSTPELAASWQPRMKVSYPNILEPIAARRLCEHAAATVPGTSWGRRRSWVATSAARLRC